MQVEILICWAVFFLPSVFSVYEYPKELIIQIHKDLVFQINSTVVPIITLRCGFMNRDGKEEVFYEGDKLNTQFLSNFYKTRLDWFGNLSSGHGWYKLRNLHLNDSKTYFATIRASGLDQSRFETEVTVTEIPVFAEKLKTLVVIAEDKDLSINCTAVATPEPNVTWVNVTDSNNMAVILKGRGSVVLKIPKITRHFNGQKFKCQALNNPNESPTETETTVLQVNYKPKISLASSNISIESWAGNNIKLRCKWSEAKPDPSWTWYNPNNHSITSNINSIEMGSELEVTTGFDLSDYGIYRCKATNVVGSAYHSITVIRLYQPSIVYNSSKHTVNESDSVTLTCEADGFPVPKITWTKSPESILFPKTGNNFAIFNVSKSDDGIYTCTASNGIGIEATANIKVTVQYKPKISLASSNISIESWAGNTIKLRCKWSEAKPDPSWTWYNPNNQSITSNINSIEMGSELEVTTGFDLSDYGIYRCKATNVVGSAYHSITVIRLFPPGRPNVTVTNVDASSAVVHWTKPIYNGGSRITGYELKVNQVIHTLGADTFRKSITNLKKSNRYEVKVSARNVVGYGNISVETFTTKDQGKPALPVVTMAEVQGTSVILRWSKPAENGASITNYTIYQKEDGLDIDWKPVSRIYGEIKLEISINDLKPGTTYYFIVTASNKFGESPIGDVSKKTTVVIPVQTTTLPRDNVRPSKGRSSGEGSDPNQTIIIVGVVVAVVLILITAIISVIILKKKKVFGKRKVPSSNRSAAYHNDVDSSDSIGRGAAIATLNADSAPTYAAVDMTKKTKKKDEIPNYAAVDKSKKKKKPGEIIYAELADFNTNNVPAAPRPAQYTETDYADISQFQNQVEAEPTYANFPGRSKDYNI